MTTGFQFAHMQWSGKSRSSKRQSTKCNHGSQRGKGWSAADILAEADRKKGHCYHVENAQPANLIHGVPLSRVEEIADYWATQQGTNVILKNGQTDIRKMRSDAPILASGVISLPRDRIGEWPAFRDHTIKQLEQRYGVRLVSAVEHLDESHPHLHFYLVPKVNENFGAVHPGYAASRAARKSEGNLIRSSYNEAMREWQDWIQEAIGAPFGLARIGPRRARQVRAELKAGKENHQLATREIKAREQEGQLAKKLAAIQRREALVEKKLQYINRADIERTQQIAAQVTDLIKQKAHVTNLVKENEKTASELKAVMSSLEPEFQQFLVDRNEFLSRHVNEEDSTERPAI